MEVLFNSMVLEVSVQTGEIICINTECGMTRVTAKSIILAMGCRERTLSLIHI